MNCHPPVFLKILETKDIQNTNRAFASQLFLGCFENGFVDFVDDPDEHSAVNSLDKGIPDVE